MISVLILIGIKKIKIMEKMQETSLLLTGMSNNASLLSDDELGDIFGGYRDCPHKYCALNYSKLFFHCDKDYCSRNFSERPDA